MRRARKSPRCPDRFPAGARASPQQSAAPPELSGTAAVQRAAGNFAIQRKCACGGSSGGCSSCAEEEGLSLQTKPAVNEPGDSYEQEAGRFADRAMEPSFRAQGAPRISRLPADGVGQSEAASDSVRQAVSGSGAALDPDVRGDMERGFGHDFSGVRVHTDANAVASARALSARAYTVGGNIVFDHGQYAPRTSFGKRLLAHELTHVVQQSAARTSAAGKVVQRDATDDLASDAARDLYNYVQNNPKPYTYILTFFRNISSDIEDNIAAAFVKLLEPAALESFAQDSDGLKVLNVLTEAMITGNVSIFEAQQAEKILIAKRETLSTAEYMTEAQRIAGLRHKREPVFSDDQRASQLAKDLYVYVANNLYRYVISSFQDIPSAIEDNVAAALVESLPDARLEEIAKDERGTGLELLDVLYEAMITGNVSAFEALQSERILLAKSRHVKSEKEYTAQAERIADLRNKAEDSATELMFDNAARDLARAMSIQAAQKQYSAITKTMRDISSSIEDNVASHFLELQTPARLEEIATDAEGRALLDVLYEAIMTGDVTAFERLQANRIIAAKSTAPSLPDLASMEQERVLVLPLRNQKFTRTAYAIFKASLQPNGKVKVLYDDFLHFEAEDMFKADRDNLPKAIMNGGIELNPDEVVVLKLYDEDKKLLPVRAIELVDYANQAMRSSVAVGAKAFEAGLFLGYGGLAAFSGRGVSSVAARVELGELSAARLALARGVLWADRVSMVLPLVSFVVDENRDWILEKFPNAGPVLLGALDQANRIANYYGWGRMGFDAARYLKSRLQPALDRWREGKAAAGKLTSEQQRAVDEIDASLKAIEDDLTKTEVAAGTEAVQHVEQNPQTTKRKGSGERYAEVGKHEVVEVRDAAGNIHCEFHSNGGPEIPCPAPWVKDQPAGAQPGSGSATAPRQRKAPEPATGSVGAKAAAADAMAEAAEAAAEAHRAARLGEVQQEIASNEARMQAAEQARLRAKKKADQDSAAAVAATGKDRDQLLDSVERNRASEKKSKIEIEDIRRRNNALHDEARLLAPPPPKPQTWQEAEDALRTQFGGRKETMPTATGKGQDLGNRDLDCFTPNDRIAREAKFGRQSATDRIKEEIAKDKALLDAKKVSSIEWHFYENVKGTIGPSGPLRELLENANIKIVIHK